MNRTEQALQIFAQGTVIPATPLVLDAEKRFDPAGQKLLNGYYLEAGAGGIATAVHSTQFEIRDPKHGLFEPVIATVAESIGEYEARTGRVIVRVAGVCGPTEQAVREAELARQYGYDAVLLSPGGLNDRSEDYLLERTADALDLPLVLDEEEEAPTGYPSPDLWPYNLSGSLMDPDHWEPELPLHEQLDPSKAKAWNVSASGTTVNAFRDGDGTLGDPRAGDEAALALFGELAGIETPGYELCTDVNYYGDENCFQHFCFEAGGATVTERLLNYSFRRVEGNLDGTGELSHFNLTFPPESETVGDYPLRTPEEAKAALQTVLDEEQASGMREYDLSAEQAEGWQLEYAQSSMNPYIQPVYRFWLKTDLTPEEAFYENAGGNVYVSYTVSALPEGYCIPFEKAFN